MKDLDGITLVEGEKITWEDSSGTTQYELWADSVPGSPETRDIYLAITPALGSRTVQRLFGFSGTTPRSDLPFDATVTTAKLVDGAVTSLKIADATIATGDLADGAVTSLKIADGSVTDTDVAAANKDGSAGTASLRTLGAGASQAAAGNDARLSDQRTPSDNSVTAAKVVDGTLGLGELSASGTKDATTFLRGDNTFAVPPTPSGNGAPNTQTANYTLVLGDAGKTIEENSASATTVTVPPNSSVAFPTGTIIEVARYGAGTVAIAAGAGVTIRSRGALLSIGNQYGAVSLRKRATDEWVLVGDLA